MTKIDVWKGRQIAVKSGFREHPKEAGVYLRNYYSNDFEGKYNETEYIVCFYTGKDSDECFVSAKSGIFLLMRKK